MKEFKKDTLVVKVMPNRDEMGKIAAADIHDAILRLLQEKDHINMIFAAAPSQNDVLQHLTSYQDIKPGKAAKRLLIAFSPSPLAYRLSPIAHSLTLESETAPRSEAYKELTKEFYL